MHGSIIADGITAWRGMVAGCVAATRELKLYLHDTLSGIIIRNPRAELDSWVDDLTVEVQEETREKAENLKS